VCFTACLTIYSSAPLAAADDAKVCQPRGQPLPCQLPGIIGLGNNSVSFIFSTWNYQHLINTGSSTAPDSPFGRGQTFNLGYLDISDPNRPILISATGSATIFIRPEVKAADAPFISEFRLLGDYRTLNKISGEYRLTQANGAYTIYSSAKENTIYPIQEVNQDGKTLWIASYNNGIPKEIKDFFGGTTTYSADPSGLITSVVTSDGASYQLAYDAQRRLTMVSRFGQALLKATYQGNQLTELIYSSGATNLFSYQEGRLEAFAEGPQITTFSYNKSSVTSETKISGTPVFTTTEYREIETLASRKWWIATSQKERVGETAIGSTIWEKTLDSNGNSIAMRDAQGQQTLLTRNEDGTIASAKSDAAEVSYTYAQQSNDLAPPKLTSISTTNPNNHEKHEMSLAWSGNRITSSSVKVNDAQVAVASSSSDGAVKAVSSSTTETFSWKDNQLTKATGPQGVVKASFNPDTDTSTVRTAAYNTTTQPDAEAGTLIATITSARGANSTISVKPGEISVESNNTSSSVTTTSEFTGTLNQATSVTISTASLNGSTISTTSQETSSTKEGARKVSGTVSIEVTSSSTNNEGTSTDEAAKEDHVVTTPPPDGETAAPNPAANNNSNNNNQSPQVSAENKKNLVSGSVSSKRKEKRNERKKGKKGENKKNKKTLIKKGNNPKKKQPPTTNTAIRNED
jgi:YD repeat-containing protein